ncbi:MAG: NAD-dependent epimerase/dehydratase family protein [Wujia sp.]
MGLYQSTCYMDDVATAASYIDLSMLENCAVAISGGTGMIGSFLVDVLMYANETKNYNIHVYVMGRNEQKAKERFGTYAKKEQFHFVKQDINNPIDTALLPEKMDYIIHAASNTHPVAYASDPIGTISANVIGTQNLLEYASSANCRRFVFLSSVEIYGENRGDTDRFAEDYLGYIDCNTMRAGYPESKRTGEALCQAYRKQKGLDIVIPRLSRVYGPTMLLSDTKALSQFILKSVHYEDIVLKSEGTQEFSYAYVADCVMAILQIMLEGVDGEAYNVCSKDSDVQLREIATVLANQAGKKVVFDLPDAVEMAGYSKATKATLDDTKICKLGFQSSYDMQLGLEHTVKVLREILEVKEC